MLTDVTYRLATSQHVDPQGEFGLADATAGAAGTAGAAAGEGGAGVSLPWRLTPRHSGGGLVMDTGCHALDAVDYIAGELVVGSARGDAWQRGVYPATSEVEDVVHVSCLCLAAGQAAGEAGEGKSGDAGNASDEGGCDGSPRRREVPLSASFNYASGGRPADEFVFTGSKGTLRFSCFGGGPLEVEGGGDFPEGGVRGGDESGGGSVGTTTFSFPPLDHVVSIRRRDKRKRRCRREKRREKGVSRETE